MCVLFVQGGKFSTSGVVVSVLMFYVSCKFISYPILVAIRSYVNDRHSYLIVVGVAVSDDMAHRSFRTFPGAASKIRRSVVA